MCFSFLSLAQTILYSYCRSFSGLGENCKQFCFGLNFARFLFIFQQRKEVRLHKFGLFLTRPRGTISWFKTDIMKLPYGVSLTGLAIFAVLALLCSAVRSFSFTVSKLEFPQARRTEAVYKWKEIWSALRTNT